MITLTFKDKKTGYLNENIIKFTENQITKIQKAASEKTQIEWKKGASGIKIQLENEQKNDLLKYKNEFFDGVSALEAIEEDDVIFKIHATQRIDSRFGEIIDLTDVYLDPDIQKKGIEVVQYLIDSSEVGNTFEWKGYEDVTFNFNGLNFTVTETKKSIEKVTIVVTFDTNSQTNIITAFKKILVETELKNKKRN